MNYGVGIDRHFPFCRDGEIFLTAPQEYDLVINEFVASNENGEMDQAGENDDWLELYNAGGQRLDLSDFYLTDDSQCPDKWRLPHKFLHPAEYYTVWIDNDEEQGENHANFKLSKDGEFLGLYSGPRFGYFPVDTFTFGPQITDQSSARLPNGSGDFVITDLITFDSNNEAPLATIDSSLDAVEIFPNPGLDRLYMTSDVPVENVEVFSVSGKLISRDVLSREYIDISDLNSGIYNLRMQVADNIFWKTFIKL